MYRTTIDFTGTQKLKDITVKSGSYSATYKMGIDDPSGTIPQAECQSEVDMVYNFEFSIIDSDYYIESVTFSQPPPSETKASGSSISASAWSTAGIIFESSGYQPLDLTDAQAPLQFIEKSKHLYAYTDTNAASETLYAWTTNEYYDRENTSKPLTVYTYSENPSINDQTYTSTGEIWDGKCWTGAETGSLKFGTQISEISGNTITVGISSPKIVEK